MPRRMIEFDRETYTAIEKLAKMSKISFSRAVQELVRIGIKSLGQIDKQLGKS